MIVTDAEMKRWEAALKAAKENVMEVGERLKEIAAENANLQADCRRFRAALEAHEEVKAKLTEQVARLEKDKAALVGALRDGTKDALDVAAAVEWIDAKDACVCRGSGGQPEWMVVIGEQDGHAPTLPEAVAALRERTKGETE